MKYPIRSLAIISLLIIVSGCNTNGGSEGPAFQISGTATLTGQWPQTGTVYLNLFSKEDVDNYDFGKVRDFETLSETNLQYTFNDVSTGSYYIILSWLDPNNQDPSTNQTIFGWYGADTWSPIVITETNNLLSINLNASFNSLQQ